MTEKKIQVLTLDELNKIAGGRKFYEEEWDDFHDCSNALTKKLRIMINSGKEAEASEINKACLDLFDKWMNDVGKAPDGSDPIYYSNYIKQYIQD